MPFIIPSNSITGGYEVTNSCRFNDGSSDHLTRNFAQAGNRKTFTISFWIKQGFVSTTEGPFIMGAGADGSNSDDLFLHTGRLQRSAYYGSQTFILRTSAKFRDLSAWSHFVIRSDTTQSTASNRMRIYVNGQLQTAFDNESYPAEDFETTYFNTARVHSIGSLVYGSTFANFFDGYMSEFCFIDGTSLDATSFGEFDEDSPTIWKPKDVSGLTFGTNGFYLDFKDSSALGNDVSGNNNDFTANNLTAIDQSTDTCTNNFATINPLDNYYAGNTFSEGNLKIVTNASVTSFSTSTFGVASGKWYFEHKIVTQASDHVIGITSKTSTGTSDWLGNTADTWGWITNGSSKSELSNNNSRTDVSSSGGYPTDGDIIGVYIDLDNNKLYFANDGTLVSSTGQSLTAAGSTTAGFYFAGAGDFGGSANTIEFNFGSPTFSISSGNTDDNGYGNFEYSPNITGDSEAKKFYAICTKNIAEFG